jgi:hypothetical protein
MIPDTGPPLMFIIMMSLCHADICHSLFCEEVKKYVKSYDKNDILFVLFYISQFRA